MDLIEIGLAQSERLLDDSFDAAWSATAAVKSNQRPQASHHFGCSFSPDWQKAVQIGTKYATFREYAIPGLAQ
jgi:hypothetical protein